jgi:hypothetical protein
VRAQGQRADLTVRVREVGGSNPLAPTENPIALAVGFFVGLRQGKVLAVQELLGHSDLEMVRRDVLFAEADIALDHAEASPRGRIFVTHKTPQTIVEAA